MNKRMNGFTFTSNQPTNDPSMYVCICMGVCVCIKLKSIFMCILHKHIEQRRRKKSACQPAKVYVRQGLYSQTHRICNIKESQTFIRYVNMCAYLLKAFRLYDKDILNWMNIKKKKHITKININIRNKELKKVYVSV